MNQNETETLGFIGLGVMGGPMCANLLKKGGRKVVAYDSASVAADEAASHGAEPAAGVEQVAGQADIVFLSLPSIDQVESVCETILSSPRRPSLIVDMSTSNVSRTRALAERLNAAGIAFVDAPVARTKQAAVDGKLFISVGGGGQDFERVAPYLKCMGSDVLHCGEVGSGQIVKILNNYMVFMTVNALSEAITIGRQAGMDAEKLLSLMSQGSADSFVLRNHGMKSLAKDEFPERTFPMTYAIKDCSLALDLAKEGGFSPRIGAYTHAMMCRARDAGFAQSYHPAVIKLIDGRVKTDLPERV
ncbi:MULTISPECIES: NAD(P)-dependent oxidoreductase [Achromobacter]|uniref:2-(Hydroxymethyl)glutarate dehydrogenase n=1 Tax=Achromobacter piechaudii TaxID=72556 RepID=A0A6S7C295_9BURK|nr:MULTISPECIES: NAD(P)-dependent oxidoreductase [Achromobacter]MPS78575.1 NAD(P)-dependent oxidoreductase [Achromobacter sp.]CAB3827542.1 2-(hydroxymethyl)glutarate dehydrogenase [Achromobacter piechaudii]